ncbi:MAG: LysR substrate-binding domain-containing protein [Cyanobacteria bacterium P01_D01_bin.14]
MEIYQLKVFLEVARYLSFTEAAEALNLTQPAVSAKIKSLETSLGVALFERLGRKIKLTTTGNYLQEAGPELVALESRLVQDINEMKRGKFSRLSIGCTPNIFSGWLPKILFEYRQKYPKIELHCRPLKTVSSLYNALAVGEVEVCFTEINLQNFDEVDCQPVDKCQYFLIVAADHRLASAQWLSLKELTSEAWVFPSTGSPERLALEARLTELGMQISDFNKYETVQSSSLMSAFLTQGHYLGFASSLQLQTERQSKLLTAIPLQEFALNSQLFMLTPKQPSRSPYRAAFDSGTPSPIALFTQLVAERTQHKISAGQVSHASPPVCSQSVGVLGRVRPDAVETVTLTIGTQNKTIQTVTAGLIIQRLALLEHFLPRDGRYRQTKYKVQWRDFASGAPIVEGLKSQHIDIGILGDYPLLLSGADPSASSGLEATRLISFVASNPDGAGNTIIVPEKSELSSLEDLRRRTIAVPFASAAHGMVMRTLTRTNLLEEVTLASIKDLSIHRLTPRNMSADGYAYFAPLHDIASHQSRFRRLLNDNLDKLPTFHGIVVRDAFADEHPEIVVAYLKALIAAQHWYMNTPSALSLVSHWVKLDPEIVAKTLDYRRQDASGLFLPETQIRTDWITQHIQQLVRIPGNEHLDKLDLNSWIQPEFLETAMASL